MNESLHSATNKKLYESKWKEIPSGSNSKVSDTLLDAGLSFRTFLPHHKVAPASFGYDFDQPVINSNELLAYQLQNNYNPMKLLM